MRSVVHRRVAALGFALPPKLDEHKRVVGADGEDHETPEEVERADPADAKQTRVRVLRGDQRRGHGGHHAEREPEVVRVEGNRKRSHAEAPRRPTRVAPQRGGLQSARGGRLVPRRGDGGSRRAHSSPRLARAFRGRAPTFGERLDHLGCGVFEDPARGGRRAFSRIFATVEEKNNARGSEGGNASVVPGIGIVSEERPVHQEGPRRREGRQGIRRAREVSHRRLNRRVERSRDGRRVSVVRKGSRERRAVVSPFRLRLRPSPERGTQPQARGGARRRRDDVAALVVRARLVERLVRFVERSERFHVLAPHGGEQRARLDEPGHHAPPPRRVDRVVTPARVARCAETRVRAQRRTLVETFSGFVVANIRKRDETRLARALKRAGVFSRPEPRSQRAEPVEDVAKPDGLVRRVRVQSRQRRHARFRRPTFVSLRRVARPSADVFISARALHRAPQLARRAQRALSRVVCSVCTSTTLARAQQDVQLVLPRVPEHARGDVAARCAVQRGPRRVQERAQRRVGDIRRGRAFAFLFERRRKEVVSRKRRVSDSVRAGVQAGQRLIPRARRGGPREVVPHRRVHYHAVALSQRDEHRQHCRGVTRQHDPWVCLGRATNASEAFHASEGDTAWCAGNDNHEARTWPSHGDGRDRERRRKACLGHGGGCGTRAARRVASHLAVPKARFCLETRRYRGTMLLIPKSESTRPPARPPDMFEPARNSEPATQMSIETTASDDASLRRVAFLLRLSRWRRRRLWRRLPRRHRSRRDRTLRLRARVDDASRRDHRPRRPRGKASSRPPRDRRVRPAHLRPRWWSATTPRRRARPRTPSRARSACASCACSTTRVKP